MKIKKGKREYKTPPIGQLVGVSFSDNVRDDNARFPETLLCHVAEQELEKMVREREDVEGRPAYFTYRELDDTITLFPKPDKDGHLRIRFFPPMEEA